MPFCEKLFICICMTVCVCLEKNDTVKVLVIGSYNSSFAFLVTQLISAFSARSKKYYKSSEVCPLDLSDNSPTACNHSTELLRSRPCMLKGIFNTF